MKKATATPPRETLMRDALVQIEGLQAEIRRLRGQLEDESSGAIRHPILDRRVVCPQPMFSGSISTARAPWLPTLHGGGGRPVPCAVWLDVALAAHGAVHGAGPTQAGAGRSVTLSDLRFDTPLGLTDGAPRIVQCLLSGDSGERFEIHSLQPDGASPRWLRHAAGEHQLGPPGEKSGSPLSEVRFRLREVMTPDTFYDELSRRGLQLGPTHRGFMELRRRGGEALGHFVCPPMDQPHADYCVHPIVLDSAMQMLAIAAPRSALASESVFVPVSMRALRWYGRPGTTCFSHVVVRSHDKGRVESDLRLRDEAGHLLLEVSSLTCEAMPIARLTAKIELTHGSAAIVDTSRLRHQLLDAGPTERAQLVEAYLGGIAAGALGLPAWKLDPHDSLYRWGLDSLLLVNLRHQIERDLGVVLDPDTLADESLTPAALASHLLQRLPAGA